MTIRRYGTITLIKIHNVLKYVYSYQITAQVTTNKIQIKRKKFYCAYSYFCIDQNGVISSIFIKLLQSCKCPGNISGILAYEKPSFLLYLRCCQASVVGGSKNLLLDDFLILRIFFKTIYNKIHVNYEVLSLRLVIHNT